MVLKSPQGLVFAGIAVGCGGGSSFFFVEGVTGPWLEEEPFE
jgi:hypothetical protein